MRDTYVYEPETGVILSSTRTGYTGDPAVEESLTTTNSYYDGTEGAAFDPGGAFNPAWLTLAQPANHRKSVDGPRTDTSDVTRFVYYPNNAAVPAAWRGRLAAVQNAAGHVTRYENYDVFGNALRVVDPNGVATESTYDTIGRMLTSTTKAVSGCNTTVDPLCATDLTSSRTYEPNFGNLAAQTSTGGEVSVHTYDTRGRLLTISRGPSPSDLRERIEYVYNSAGRKTAERTLAFEAGSWVEKKREDFTWDSFERLTRTTHADATFVEYSYDAGHNLTEVQDENHSSPNTFYVYNPDSQLTLVRQTLGAGEVVTDYDYDLHGNLTSVTDPNGNVTSYLFDDFGRMLRQTSPVTGTTTYTYDPAGNLVSTTDSRGAVTTRSYDALGRVTQSVTTLGLESETVTWGYDSGTFGIGRLATMTDPSGSTTYAYQRLGMLASEIRTTGGEVYVSSYTYAEDGERASLTYPSGRRVDYGYDWAGRPTTASVGGTTHYVTGATYLPFGPMTSLSYGNGVTKTVQFDNRYRVDRITLGALADYDYTSDPAGNITGIADLTDPAYNRTYGYDELNRLTTAASGASLWGAGTYAYDAMGNMTSYQIGSRTGAFAWQGTTPKIATATEAGAVVPVSYDAAGNELTGTRANGAGVPSEQRWYSPRNSLHLVYLSPSGTVTRPCEVGQICPNAPVGHTYYELGYDGRGIRTTEVVHDGATATARHYTYSPEMSLLGWKTPGVPAGLEVIWFAGAPIAQEEWGLTTASRLTLTDHLGTPLLQMNGSGAVVWRAEYEPYGNVYAMRTGTKDDQPLRFPGQERLFDGSTGTEERYNIFRWYRSGWARYSQADPLLGGPSTVRWAFSARSNSVGARHHFAFSTASGVNKMDRLGLDTGDPNLDTWFCWAVAQHHGQSYEYQEEDVAAGRALDGEWCAYEIKCKRWLHLLAESIFNVEIPAPRYLELEFPGPNNPNYPKKKGCKPCKTDCFFVLETDPNDAAWERSIDPDAWHCNESK